MKILVSSCDKYDHLLPGFAVQWNKYWGDPVDVVGFREPPPLPANFRFHQLEPVETRSWSANIRLFLEKVGWNHFVFLFDDYWLKAPVNLERIGDMEEWVLRGAVKGDLSRNTDHFDHKELKNGLVEATQDAQYRTSTQPAIWSRAFMLQLLQGDMNPWQFELQGNPAKRKGRIIGTKEQLVPFANAYYKGAPDIAMLRTLSVEDITDLEEKGLMPCQLT